MTAGDIGTRLKEERERLGLSRTRMGEIGLVGKTTQINYEKGVYSPDAAYLAAIAGEGVDVLYVLTGKRAQISEQGLSDREKAVLADYKSLSKENQASVQRLTHAFKEPPPLSSWAKREQSHLIFCVLIQVCVNLAKHYCSYNMVI